MKLGDFGIAKVLNRCVVTASQMLLDPRNIIPAISDSCCSAAELVCGVIVALCYSTVELICGVIVNLCCSAV